MLLFASKEWSRKISEASAYCRLLWHPKKRLISSMNFFWNGFRGLAFRLTASSSTDADFQYLILLKKQKRQSSSPLNKSGCRLSILSTRVGSAPIRKRV